jgi:glycosyltransferase involved in cell wall biosynthesis
MKGRQTMGELTIVIPAKNEARLIPRLLTSLTMQDFPEMRTTKVLVADASSTDGTPEAVLSFVDRLNISVIPGGLPSEGRNAGAAAADTRYVLFLDADIVPASNSLISRAVRLARNKHLDCVTTNIFCQNGSMLDTLFYLTNSMFQHLSRIHKPFSTGMFMLFDKRRFDELGGFDEKVQYAEDYLLSQKVARSKFGIVRGGVYTTNRRLAKMGHGRAARLFFATAFNYWNNRFFLRDHNYWQA